MSRLTTDELLKQLRSVNSISELTEYTSALGTHNSCQTFSEYIHAFINNHKIATSTLVEASQIQRTYAYQILNGSKNPGREKVLALCISAGMNLEETQRALTLAGLGKLYPRRKEDSIIIFALERGLNVLQTNELLYEECGQTL